MTPDSLPYPVLAVEGGGGDQGATAKPSGSHLSGEATKVSSSLRDIDPSRGPSSSEQIYQARWRHMFVVFDLDGTLALTEHRSHFLDRETSKKDWRAFYSACDKDEPHRPIVRTLLALAATGADVEIWSGRSDEVKDKTTAWLAEHGMGHIPIRTRREGDHRPDTVVKAEWLDEGRKPDLIFEDRASVVAMWRERGIIVCQVAPGNF